MKRLALPIFATALLCFALLVGTGPAGAWQGSSALTRSTPATTSSGGTSAPMSYQEQNTTVGRYCFRCHNDQLLTGGLTLESFDVEHAYDAADIVEKMIRKLRAGMMPPKGAQQPDDAARMALVAALETTIDAAAATNPNPGRRTFQPVSYTHLPLPTICSV